MAQNDTLIKGWQPVIGLEVHVQLMTNTKLFSPAKNQFGEDANTLVDLIALGLPGVLPVLNEGAMKQGIKFGFCLLYTSPSPRDQRGSRMPSAA